ncbi:pheromone-regulated multispanning membrane protein Prm1, putative [Metarhizium acridum CQMa 102]|uniref:Plasma membrane fusion protein PRM1 n=1 Tax=Metarhizium acridum (strain CQMa 102) TaxID=655827 RepID=E9EFW7_METAQ|nr:pheromone-regulated multispanning membrane protein Prm1, putative [Metarhizium acridum CQMa 102]EFY85200.1 pheromone-regulated multispanning membrane protein Prm1, putative [Metarhizium acridum CQMa 102]
MPSSRNQSSTVNYPNVPGSLHAHSIELSEIQKGAKRTTKSTTPYLGLSSRLSQVWINRWTILLLLVLVRIILLLAQLNDNVDDAKAKALAACTKVEDVGSAMASMPHYLSAGVNHLAASSISKAVHAMVKVLDLIIQGVEAIILWYINFLTATYVCLITALVHASLDVVASVTKDATAAFNKVIDGATGEIQEIAGGLQKTVGKIKDGIQNSIFSKFNIDLPSIDFTKPVEKLKGFNLNSSQFVTDVQKLNKDLPDFDGVQNLTKQAISIPFNFVREALNKSLGNYRFNETIFPLAKKEQLKFCSNNDKLDGFFSKLFDLIHKAKVFFVIILSSLAVAAMAPMAWMEIRRWRSQEKAARLIEQNKLKNEWDSMDVSYIASRPTTAFLGIEITSRMSGRRKVLARWCFAYATSGPAIFVLSLAIAGLFSCLCQYVILKAVQKEVPELTKEIGEFADEVVAKINNISANWAADANGVVKGLNDDINNDVLKYVTNATGAVNNTINVFLGTLNKGLETVFNGTILLKPIQSVLHCVIGIKLESVQKGLTWVHDHAHVDFPLFDNNTFSLGAQQSVSGDSGLQHFLASPSSATTDEVSAAVNRVTNWLLKGIIKEALISTGVLLVYVIVVLIGLIRTLAGMAFGGRDPESDDLPYAGQTSGQYESQSGQPGSSQYYHGRGEKMEDVHLDVYQQHPYEPFDSKHTY